jgi:2-polyprenyl-3-methyl-5-hydroxy-6-metoxy-1,4-benzoquinol methylase
MPAPATADYDARWGYRELDARRYERRRYGGPVRTLNLRLLERALGRALAGVARGGLVLDVPCGTGILGGFFATRGFRVVGADISGAMLAVAHGRQHAIGHVRADLEAPPCRPGAFDAVVCARFLMHLPAESRPRVLRTLTGLTRGPVVATVCHPYTLKSLGRSLRRRLGRAVKRSPRLTRRALAAEVAAAGLRLERVIPVLPLLSEVWVVVIRNGAAST